jgi:hypothetical protein
MMVHLFQDQTLRKPLMFSILRFILIVGAIFYYSPVRQPGEGTAGLESILQPRQPASRIEPSAAEGTGKLETLWQWLPTGAKQAVVDRVLTTSGLTAAEPKPRDTLQPGDRQTARP